MNQYQRAARLVEETPEHELRRLLERIAVHDPSTVIQGIERMRQFGRIARRPFGIGDVDQVAP